MQQLILAIDSDPRQAAQLAALVRARLKVELVQATSSGEGLAALGDRAPDLILTSPLLSPFDEGVLDEYLRDLGSAATHVQTLRIPVLSAAPKKKSAAGRLFSLGRKKQQTSSAAPDGCDPRLFADEIAQYLTRAAEDRHASASRAAVAPVVTYELEAAPAPAYVEPAFAQPDYAEPAQAEPNYAEPAYAEPAYAEPAYAEPAYAEPAYAEPAYAEPAHAERAYAQPAYAEPAYEEPAHTEPAHTESEWALPEYVQPSYRMDAQESTHEPVSYLESVLDARVGEPVASVTSPHQNMDSPVDSVYTAPLAYVVEAEPEAPAALVREEPTERVSLIEPAPVPAAAAAPEQPRLSNNSASFEAALAAIRAAWSKPAKDGTAAPAPSSTASGPSPIGRGPVNGSGKPGGAAQVEVDLTREIDSLEDVIGDEAPSSDLEPQKDSETSSAKRTIDKSRKRQEKAGVRKAKGPDGRPSTDEWGGFDPNQGGFSALVNTLDDVTNSDEIVPRVIATRRVIPVV